MGYYLDSPITWVPYMNNKDCSQEFCSVYCPQWCYIIVSPPPPIVFPDSNSTPNISPLVIAIITILACAFLLVIYYTVISKYCGNTSEHSRREHSHHTGEQLEDNQSPSIHEPWHVGTTNGLDEAWINSLTVCKYKKEDEFIEGTDCSVCLSEFEENENIRLLPKCNHAFHLPCIDTWLKSHSNCPMCRANIVCVNALNPPQTQTQVPLINESMVVSQIQRVNENVMSVGQEQQRVDGNRVIEQSDQVVPKTPPRVYSDLGNSEERDTIIEIRGTSLDHNSQQNRVLVADILNMDEDEDVVNEEQIMDFVGMSTSFSSGRF